MCKFKIVKNRLPASVCLSALLGLSALLLPSTADAQLHGLGGNLGTFGTNCAGQCVAGFVRAGDTAFITIQAIYTDGAGLAGGGDRSVITNLTVSTASGCLSFTSPNLLTLNASPPIPPGNIVGGVFPELSNPAYLSYIPVNLTNVCGVQSLAVPIPANCSGNISFVGLIQGYDTNNTSGLNIGGALQANPSADIFVIQDCLRVTKFCTNGIGENGLITWTGTIQNCGNASLSGVVVTNFFNGTNALVFGPVTLTNGEVRTFNGSYHPNNICSPSTDTLVGVGTDLIGCLVAATNSATCSLVLTPCVTVQKACGPSAIDLATGSFQVSGSVSNCGNVTLSGVRVTDTITNRNSSGAVLSVTTVTTSLGPVAPQSAIAIPAQTITVTNCGSISDFFTVIGTNVCGGTVTNISNVCTTTVTNQACIGVSKVCAPPLLDLALNPTFTVSGSVTNCGNEPLTGVTVTDTITNANGVVTTVTVLSGATVPAHGTVAIPSSTITPSGCGTVSDFFTATGNGPCGPASATSLTCSTVLSNTPCMGIVKNCGPATTNAGSSYAVSGFVTNCGSGPLTSIAVKDIVTDPSGNKTTNAVSLSSTTLAGHTALPFGPITIPTSLTNCGPYQDQFVVTALGLCSNPTPASSAVCTTTTTCPQPDIKVFKDIACGPAGANPTCTNGAYLSVDTGADGAAFCYRIIVSNPSPVVTLIVTNLTDTIISGSGTAPALLGFNLPLTLAPHQSVTNFPGPIVQPLGTNVNQVVATGVDAATLSSVTQAVATATAIVKPMGVSCDITLSSTFNLNTNGTGDCPVTLPAGSSNSPVAVALTLHNTGQVDLNVKIIAGNVLSTLVNCVTETNLSLSNLVVFVPAGQSVTTNLGCALVTCPGTSITASVQGTAVASTLVPCIFDSTGAAVKTAPSSCNACVNCAVALSCRVTGGGTLQPGGTDTNCVVVTTTLFDDLQPADVVLDHISHGGQLGAPFSMADCGEILGNPCIRGQWQHNRHYQGTGNPKDQIDADFHSNTPKGVFDTLMCACLGCCSDGQFIGSGVVNNLCNPDDHKLCGPEPRPAPANAIIFTGVGSFKPQDSTGNGKKSNARYVIFRVYIEDRSEPGGLHPGGANKPADVYCFQAWDTGIPTDNKTDFSTVATVFRRALAADSCAFIRSISTSTATGVPPGTLPSTTVAGLAADIVDQGPVYNGNQQIHPSTSAICP